MHHIKPVYLKKNHNLFGNIDISYNLVNLPYLVHLLIHALRFVELGYSEDIKAIRIIYEKLCYILN